MLKKKDIYESDQKIKSYLRRIEKLDITKRNKKFILDYKDWLFMQGLSKPRVLKYLEISSIIARKMKKDFDNFTRKDIEKFLAEIQQKNYYP